MTPTRFRDGLLIILVVGAVARCGYLLALHASDPTFALPILDGAYYLEWARALREGSAAVSGAFYLAPLPAYWLVAVTACFGESPFAVVAAGLLLNLAGAGIAGLLGRRLAGDVAGWLAAAVFLMYHPLLFFAARPLGESLGILLLLSGALAWLAEGTSPRFAGGVLWGLAALARPNLLLVPLVASALDLARRDVRRAGLLAGGLAVVILPVTIRNWHASGHPVPISANGGVTFFHGNGPDARGTYQPAAGLSGSVAAQRSEATALARARTGQELDDVEADAWWGQQALSARVADPCGTLALGLRKLGLAVDNAEHGLDYAPRLDADPWRWTAPVPFAALLALAVYYFAVSLPGNEIARRWLVVTLASGAVLVAFYVSSRYRLPFAAMLTVPAGAGLARALTTGSGYAPKLLATAALVLSCAIPSGQTLRWSDAVGMANSASARRRAGDLAGAERELRAALRLDPDSVPVLYNLGVVATQLSHPDEAESLFRRALAIDPASAEAATNLGSLLIGTGRSREAVPVLRAALERRPGDRACWTNLVVALAASGAADDAKRAAADAARAGITLDAGLLREIDAGASR